MFRPYLVAIFRLYIPSLQSLYTYANYAVYDDDISIILVYLLLLQSALQPLVGFRPAQLSLSILSRKVLLSAVVSGTSNPQLGEEPGIQSVPTFATRGPQHLKRR
jgi:hypothetical protein